MMRLESLPLRHDSYGGFVSSNSGRRGSASTMDTVGLGEYLRRVLDYQQMDFEAAAEDITMLVSPNPERVYKMASYRKHTKNHWARDDPAFAVILMLFLTASSVAFGLAFGARGPTAYLLLVLRGVVLDWLVVGLLVATAGRWVANRYLLRVRSHSVEQQVEWSYAFDIHCNASFYFLWLTSVLQYFLLPVLLGRSLLCAALSNLLYAGAFICYFYVTHLGYRALPFLQKSEVFLYPAVLATFFFVLSLSLGFLGESTRFNSTRLMAHIIYAVSRL